MSVYPKFSMTFNIGATNDERIEAFTMYQQAFDAKKLSETTSPGGDVHIIMEINGFSIMLAPGACL